ncbi:MAG: hypothetical protein ACK5P7_05600 [Bdellovibrio sp.]
MIKQLSHSVTFLFFVVITLIPASPAFAKKNTPAESANIEPTLSSRSATCDLAFMDEFYNELKGGVCLSGSLIEADCVKFSASEALTFLPFLLGLGRVLGITGGVTSGLTAREGYMEEETPAQKLGRNRLTQAGIRCEQPYQKYMTNQLDHQVHEEEYERPAPEDENGDDGEETPASRRRQTAAQRAQAERAREETARARRQTAVDRQKDLGWWCAPYYGAHNMVLSKKNIEFLQLPEAKRRKLLCEHPELRDYYQRLMEPYTARLRAKTQIVGLACDGDSGFKFITEHDGKKTVFDVKLSPLGNYLEAMSSPSKAEDSPAYVSWRQSLANAERSGRPMPDTFQINNRPTTLVPGRFLFNFRDTNAGAQLTSVNLINGSFTPMSSQVVATIEAARLESVVRGMANANPHAELPTMAKNYQMFNLRADEAKACCQERNPTKKQTCMKELDGGRLSPPLPVARPSTPATPRPPPTRNGTQR